MPQTKFAVKPVCVHPARPDAKQCRDCPLRAARTAPKVTVNRPAASAPRSPGGNGGGKARRHGEPVPKWIKVTGAVACIVAMCIATDRFTHEIAQPTIASPGNPIRLSTHCPSVDKLLDGPLAGYCMPETQDIGEQQPCQVSNVGSPEEWRERQRDIEREQRHQKETDRIEDQEKRDKRHDFKFRTPPVVRCLGPIVSNFDGDSAQGALGGGGN